MDNPLTVKSEKELGLMWESGQKLAIVMAEIEKMAKPGVSTKELDKHAEMLVFKSGAKPAFKGYQGYPASLCVSVNNEIVHALPGERILKDGDIVGLDCGLEWKGFFSDMAVSVGIGEISPENQRLIRTAKKALKRGIKKARPGITTGDIGNTIQRFVEDQGFGVVRELCGHGIGRELHEKPEVPNFGKRREGIKLEEGMAIAIEPMITAGHWKIKISNDGFGIETADGSMSAHFEHTIAIVKDGCVVLTEL